LDRITNPIDLQKAINEVKVVKKTYASREELIEDANKSLKEWREVVEEMNPTKSDKLKLLALPFYLARRTQVPEP